jgi:hypothetical protein
MSRGVAPFGACTPGLTRHPRAATRRALVSGGTTSTAMDDVQASDCLGAGTRLDGSRRSLIVRASNCLRLAAAPAFAFMAMYTRIHGGDMPDVLCSATRTASPLAGMVPMYVLMSIFHSAPWLNLIRGRFQNPNNTSSQATIQHTPA